MISMKTQKKYILTIILFAIILNVKAQSESEMKAIYVAKFIELITWPNEAEIDTFSIAIVGEDREFTRRLTVLLKNKKRFSKSIKIKLYRDLHNIINVNLIYIPKDYFYDFPVYDFFKAKNTLIISNGRTDKSQIMLNFLVSIDNKIQFEIHNPNIINSGFQADPKLILLGGTQIDVANLYAKTQTELNTEKIRSEIFKEELTNLKIQQEEQQKIIDNQLEKIKEQENNLSLKESEIKEIIKLIDIQKKNQEKLKLQVNEINKELTVKKKDYINQTKEIELKEQELQQKNIEISDSQKILIDLQNRIHEINEEFQIQETKIRLHKKTISLFIIAIILTLLVLSIIYKAFKNKIKSNKLIEEKNKRISEHKEEIEATLNRLKDTQVQLVSAEKMASLGQLTAGIAHEINNPINFISSGVFTLKQSINDVKKVLSIFMEVSCENVDEKLPEIYKVCEEIELDIVLYEIDKLLESIEIGAMRTTEIVKGLRTFSRLDEDALKYIDFHENIESTLILLKTKLKNKITIKREYSDIPKIECYPGPINQVLMNILSNAIDAIEHSGTIHIRTFYNKTDQNGFLKLEIEDSGAGIEPEKIKHIFEPFYTTKDIGKGTGLGLSICYGIIKKHNGEILVDSIVNKRTIFTILLPITHN
jgi:signal transduction histidine kinase